MTEKKCEDCISWNNYTVGHTCTEKPERGFCSLWQRTKEAKILKGV
jgi:hypothetical protein